MSDKPERKDNSKGSGTQESVFVSSPWAVNLLRPPQQTMIDALFTPWHDECAFQSAFPDDLGAANGCTACLQFQIRERPQWLMSYA